MIVLPWIGNWSAVSGHVRVQQELGIDPSAMFYSELEIAPGIAHRIERLQQTHTMSWNRSSRSDGVEAQTGLATRRESTLEGSHNGGLPVGSPKTSANVVP